MYLLTVLVLWLCSLTFILCHPYVVQHLNRQTFTNDRSGYSGVQFGRTYGNQNFYPIYRRQVLNPVQIKPTPVQSLPLELSHVDNTQETEQTNVYQESTTQITTYTSEEPIAREQTTDKQDFEPRKTDHLKAVAVLRGKAKGVLFFEQIGDKVYVTGSIEGLTNGLHAFHVHHYGDLTRSCGSSGDHFNPHNTKHGSPFDSIRHVGDLGNVFADESGVAKIDIQDKFMSLRDGKNNILGHTIIVHENVDDLGRGGHVKAGRRIGCGIIGWRNDLD